MLCRFWMESSECFLNGSLCLFPLEYETCSCVWENGEGKNYSPSDKEGFDKLTLGDVYKYIGIKKGDVVCKKVISEEEFESLAYKEEYILGMRADCANALREEGYGVHIEDKGVFRNVYILDEPYIVVIAKGTKS